MEDQPLKPINLSSRKWMSQLSFALCVSFLVCLEQTAGQGIYKGRSAVSSNTGNKGGAGKTSSINVGWTRFEDPLEHAFSLSVPQGWTVQGGLFRLGFADHRMMVSMKSPDGKFDLRIGDVSIPNYALPNMYYRREGENYDLGAQAQLVVARYRTGPQFAVFYSRARFGSVCKYPQQNPPNVDFTMPDYLALGSAQGRASAGQIAWLCQTDAGPRVALTFTRTLESGQIWQVPTMVSALAPPDEVEQARSVALHCVQSFQVSEEWRAYQQNMDAEGMQYQQMRQQQRRVQIGAQVQQFEAQMHAMQSQVNAFERHQAMQADQVNGFTNALVGLTPTTDPMTAENRMVWTGTKDNYWVNGLGQVVNSTNAPSSSFRQLLTP
jgi:hypothetical protein